MPSVDEVEEFIGITGELNTRCTANVGESFVATYGSGVKPLEGHNMRFARAQLDPDVVILPRVLAIFQRPVSPPRRITYIITERIQGDTLKKKCDKLDDAQKLVVSDQLRKAFDSVHNIPHPGFYGRIDNSGLRHNLFRTDTPVLTINGPFASIDDFIEGMLSTYEGDDGPGVQHKADFYRRVFPRAVKGDGAPVFTHGSFRRENVIVRRDGSIALVNWATSGWYPSYWEYTMAMFACGNWEDNWHAFVGRIFDEYVSC